MITATTEKIPGKQISSHLGVVCGNTVRAKHVGRDIMAGLKTLVGGEVSGYTEMLQESRNQATDRMIAQAKAMGADAIVNVRFTTSQVAQGMSEMLAYGSAVKLSEGSGTTTPPPIS
ncbi:MAG: heavy metal-binding domain-containing protein [Akkermansiaceae bacterium]